MSSPGTLQADHALASAREQMGAELAKAAANLSQDARRVFYMATRDAAAAWLYDDAKEASNG